MRRLCLNFAKAGCFGRFLFLFFLSVQPVFSSLTNRTIDDQFGDEVTGLLPSYSPVAAWEQGATCAGCVVRPDASQAYRGSWHDTTHTPGDAEPRIVNLMFNGTAIYAYFIIANTVQFATTLTNLTFYLDDASVGTYVHVPDSTSNYEYNIPAYSNGSIPNGQHTLTIEATGDTNSSLMLFDYATYTFDSDPVSSSSVSSVIPSASASTPTTPSSNSPHSNHIAPIIGATIGGIVFAGFLLATFILFRRRKPHRIHNEIQSIRQSKIGNLGGLDDGSTSSGTQTQPDPMAIALTPYTYSALESSSILGSTPPDRSPDLPITEVPSTEYGYGVGMGMSNTNASHRGEGAIAPANSDLRAGPPHRSKAAIRQQELARQIRDRERSVADLQQRHAPSSLTSNTPSSSHPGSSVDPLSSVGGNGETVLKDQIEALQREVERLRAEQTHMLWDMNNAPPPVYEEGRRLPSPPASRAVEKR